MELIEEVSQTWIAETGLPAPYEKTVSRWLDENDVEQVFVAVRKTGRKVRAVAGRENEFSLGQAISYTGNILRSAREARSLAVTE
jgi:hypothetical protein